MHGIYIYHKKWSLGNLNVGYASGFAPIWIWVCSHGMFKWARPLNIMSFY